MNIKKAFSNSLLSLLYKKPLSKITIGDLLEDTELSRQTFYNHFLDKNDLIAYVYDTVIVNRFNEEMSIDFKSALTQTLNSLKKYETFIEQACLIDGQNSLKEHMLHHCIEFDLKWRECCIGEPLSKELKFATLYHTNASHSMVLQWILEGMKEPVDELVDNINHMRYLGLKELLGNHCPYR